MKKVLAYLAGFFSAIVAMFAGVWIANATSKPTTQIKGKVKANRGSSISLFNKESRETRKERRKLKKLLK